MGEREGDEGAVHAALCMGEVIAWARKEVGPAGAGTQAPDNQLSQHPLPCPPSEQCRPCLLAPHLSRNRSHPHPPPPPSHHSACIGSLLTPHMPSCIPTCGAARRRSSGRSRPAAQSRPSL
eukprot:363609-Chlamydomonas_euryale.AAC.23